MQAEAAILNLGKTLPTPLKQPPRLSGDFLSLSRHFSPHTRRLTGRGFKVFRLANSSDRVKKEGKGILTPPLREKEENRRKLKGKKEKKKKKKPPPKTSPQLNREAERLRQEAEPVSRSLPAAGGRRRSSGGGGGAGGTAGSHVKIKPRSRRAPPSPLRWTR